MSHLPRYLHTKGDITTTTEYLPVTEPLLQKWVENVSNTPLFEFYDVYLVGSFLQDVRTPDDVDIIVTGSLSHPNYVYVDMLEALKIARVEMGMNMDMLFCPDISFMKTPVRRDLQTLYDVYIPYNIEILIENHKLVRFRDFSRLPKLGMLTKTTFVQPSDKALERGYPEFRYKKLN